MGTLKWVAGIIGWCSGGPIGALLGFLIGGAFERSLIRLTGDSPRTSQGRTASGSSTSASNTSSSSTQRGSFMMSLLVLSSAVIRADGRILQQELNCVRDFLRRNFGNDAADEGMRILDGLNRQDINVYAVGAQIAQNMNYSQRQQLFHYLCTIAAADGDFCEREKSVLESIGTTIGLSYSDTASIIAMFRRSDESAYTVLEISPSATDEEVKAAYRRMAMKNHPDKVASLGPDVQKAAEEKFRKIQEAYETIKKQRNIN